MSLWLCDFEKKSYHKVIIADSELAVTRQHELYIAWHFAIHWIFFKKNALNTSLKCFSPEIETLNCGCGSMEILLYNLVYAPTITFTKKETDYFIKKFDPCEKFFFSTFWYSACIYCVTPWKTLSFKVFRNNCDLLFCL